MGNCHFKTEFESENVTALTKQNFNYAYCIGKGGFGKVWKVDRKKSKQNYAMKEMSKARIITKRSVKSVMNERQILTMLNNPFLVNMYYAFQDRDNLYLVMDLLSGGDLRYHICKYRKFSEEQTKFFIACLVAGLEFIHNKNIIHRDIKPENLVLDDEGYLRITDFGIARIWRPDNSQDTSGTPGYMAPEVMCRQNHGVSVDYFAVGVMAFECMFGRRPYVGKSRQEIRDHILSKQVQIKRNEIPRGWSLEAADFINKMIQRKPMNRLGLNGPSEVKNHPWLKDFPWQDLFDRKVKSPFVPPKEDNFDQKNINEDWKDQEDEQFKQNVLMLRRNSVQSLFNGYYFDYQLAALSQNSAFINTSEMAYAQASNQNQNNNQTPTTQVVKPPKPGPMPMYHGQYPRSECQTPKSEQQLEENHPSLNNNNTIIVQNGPGNVVFSRKVSQTTQQSSSNGNGNNVVGLSSSLTPTQQQLIQQQILQIQRSNQSAATSLERQSIQSQQVQKGNGKQSVDLQKIPQYNHHNQLSQSQQYQHYNSGTIKRTNSRTAGTGTSSGSNHGGNGSQNSTQNSKSSSIQQFQNNSLGQQINLRKTNTSSSQMSGNIQGTSNQGIPQENQLHFTRLGSNNNQYLAQQQTSGIVPIQQLQPQINLQSHVKQ